MYVNSQLGGLGVSYFQAKGELERKKKKKKKKKPHRLRGLVISGVEERNSILNPATLPSRVPIRLLAPPVLRS